MRKHGALRGRNTEQRIAVLEAGGTVCLDLRKRYLRRMPDTLARLLEAGRRTDLFEDPRSFRVVLTGG